MYLDKIRLNYKIMKFSLTSIKIFMYVSVNFDLTPREPNYYGQTGLSIKECYISLFH